MSGHSTIQEDGCRRPRGTALVLRDLHQELLFAFFLGVGLEPSQHFLQNDCERVDVRLLTVLFEKHDFWGHVPVGTATSPIVGSVHLGADAKIAYFAPAYFAPARLHEDVLWLQIPVDDPGIEAMEVAEPFNDVKGVTQTRGGVELLSVK